VNRHEVIEAIVLERAKLLDLVDQLGADGETRAVTAEGWTAKDVLAHLIHWAGQMAWALGATMHPPAWVESAGSEPPQGDDAWNARVVAHYRPMPFAVVRRDFDTVVDALLDRLRRREDLDVNVRANVVIPWIKSDVPVWKAIAGETFEHWPGHAADLERALSSRGGVR
jgi:Mycothiol maleylpyruvate isomerase N-terminal domain